MKPAVSRQVTEFEGTAPLGAAVDMGKVVEAKSPTEPYRVVAGEVIELAMQGVIPAASTRDGQVPGALNMLDCRVTPGGSITLPLVGEVHVAGLTLSQVESAVAKAYCPAYTQTPPPVYAKIVEYKTFKASILGAVQKPGVYTLRSEQMSLVSLIMEAGGISEKGATSIRIVHAQGSAGPPQAGSGNVPGIQPTRSGRAPSVDSYPARWAAFASPDPRPSEEDLGVDLAFRPQSEASTAGQLTVTRQGRVLLRETLDLSNESARAAALSRLAGKAEAVPIVAVDQRLEDLELVLRHGADASSDRGATLARQSLRPAETLLQERVPAEPAGRVQRVRMVAEQQDDSRVGGFASAREVDHSGQAVVLPVRGLNIPFADVTLREGDTVIVEPLKPQIFTVIGLVNKPDNYPYPPETTYNLAQAIGFAGGADRVADPRYAVVYRLKSDGTIVHLCLDIRRTAEGSDRPSSLEVTIRPGDVIALEQTPRTRTREFLYRVFNISVGAYVPVSDRH
jgi:protein involved in polysaccharide export with SLBB domain